MGFELNFLEGLENLVFLEVLGFLVVLEVLELLVLLGFKFLEINVAALSVFHLKEWKFRAISSARL